MNHQRICELTWRTTPSVKTIADLIIKLWLRFMKLECLCMWIKHSNIQKLKLEVLKYHRTEPKILKRQDTLLRANKPP